MTLETPRSFNSWLRSQLKEKKMSQRQLALQSGVDHSTISRLIKGDRMPSLGTATKLARGLREIHDEAEGPAYFASLTTRQLLPTARVEYALRGDDALNEGDVRELMQAYIAVRSKRVRDNGSGPNDSQTNPGAPAKSGAGSEGVGASGVRRGA
jgi:transcriptional regulator with XRE-family HTH domain